MYLKKILVEFEWNYATLPLLLLFSIRTEPKLLDKITCPNWKDRCLLPLLQIYLLHYWCSDIREVLLIILRKWVRCGKMNLMFENHDIVFSNLFQTYYYIIILLVSLVGTLWCFNYLKIFIVRMKVYNA